METSVRFILIAVLLGVFIDFTAINRFSYEPEPTGSGYRWTNVLDEGPWKKSYNFQLLSHRDTLWVFHPDGNWFSVDGRNWQSATLPNAIGNLAFLDYISFNNAVLGLGRFEGNSETYQFRPVIYQTRDLKRWTVLAEASNLPRRFFYHPFVFRDKLWIIGGEDSRTKFADCWNSTDGVHWRKVKDNLPFGKRSGSQIVRLRDKLYLLNNDVWSSEDGLNWKLETAEIVKDRSIFGYSAVVLDDKIWLLGCNRNGQFTSNVLVSSDGRNWQEHRAPWSPRGGMAACAFRGQIYVTGGKYGGQDPHRPRFAYSNDVWVLQPN